jgi:hypothetical protein
LGKVAFALPCSKHPNVDERERLPEAPCDQLVCSTGI